MPQPRIQPQESLWRHVLGATESQREFSRAADPYRRQYSKKKSELQKSYTQQKSAVKRYFDQQKRKKEFKKIRHQFNITAEAIERDPEKGKMQILEKLRKRHVYEKANLKRQHLGRLKDLRGELKKSASKPYSSVA